MRILIDLQALQTLPAGRSSAARDLIGAMLDGADGNEFTLLLNGVIGDDIGSLRRKLAHKWPSAKIRVWTAVPVSGAFGSDDLREAAEAIREAVIFDCAPDIVLLAGYPAQPGDEVVTFTGQHPTAVIIEDPASRSPASYAKTKQADLLLLCSPGLENGSGGGAAPAPRDGLAALINAGNSGTGSGVETVVLPGPPGGCAALAINAMEKVARENASRQPALGGGKPRLAFVSPLPPERSGIGYYSAELLPALAEHYDIDLIVDQDEVTPNIARAKFAVRDGQWLRDHATQYDRVLYHFGNSPFHAHMFDLLADVPGVIVLHDFFLSDFERSKDPVGFIRLLVEAHGYRAVLDNFDMAGGRDGPAEAMKSWPVNIRALQLAQGVIVHSEHARRLARKFYDASTVDNWTVVPHLRVPAVLDEETRLKARAELGIEPDHILICSFGHLTENKSPLRVIDGLLHSASAADSNVRFVFVGDAGKLGGDVLARTRGTPLEGRVHITGWAADDLYHRYLQAADIAVQLRRNSRGESSGTVLDCQNYALPVIVNAHGSLVDLPKDTLVRIEDEFSDRELADAIDLLVQDPERRAKIGRTARKMVEADHAPDVCARAYREAIEAYHRAYDKTRGRVAKQLAHLPPGHPREAALYQAAADSLPVGARLRQLFVDVSALVQEDLNTGIQRVVRAITQEWLRHPPEGWRVEPVYADLELRRYRYARRFTSGFLGVPDEWAEDAPIDYFAGDQFIGIDLHVHAVVTMQPELSVMSARGVATAFIVYDLLPVLMPQHFPSVDTWFARWLETIANHAQLICISKAVADELRDHLAHHPPSNGMMPDIDWFHLGADLETATTKAVLPGGDTSHMPPVPGPRFLMVGTIEPRKGHAFTLDAFEKFWASGGDASLVIVGKKGWSVDELCNRMRTHPESGKRLIWLERVSDAQLQELYRGCNCLIAASEGEGFGLPLIEAARYDLPILARDIPVFREVAGNSASYFDGSDPENLCQAIGDWLLADAAGNTPKSGDIGFLTWRESANALLGRLGIGAPGQ